MSSSFSNFEFILLFIAAATGVLTAIFTGISVWNDRNEKHGKVRASWYLSKSSDNSWSMIIHVYNDTSEVITLSHIGVIGTGRISNNRNHQQQPDTKLLAVFEDIQPNQSQKIAVSLVLDIKPSLRKAKRYRERIRKRYAELRWKHFQIPGSVGAPFLFSALIRFNSSTRRPMRLTATKRISADIIENVEDQAAKK